LTNTFYWARGHALDNEYQIDFYIEGLEPTLGYQVRRQNPADLNAAINLARREEEAKDELIGKTMNVTDRIYPDIGKGYDEKQDVKPKNMFNKQFISPSAKQRVTASLLLKKKNSEKFFYIYTLYYTNYCY
jgi:hypothetical protein